MKTIVLEQPEALKLADQPPPGRPGPGEVVVRVHRVGICGTDLHAFKGRQPFFSYPRILGHELGVEVIEVGPGVEGIRPGERCAVNPYLNCGVCPACRRGKPNCCEKLRVLGVHIDGGMREALIVPAAHLHRSARLGFEELALAEMLCIGAHAVARAALTPGQNVLVIGAGPIGLSTIQFAKKAGANVLLMEISPERAAFCREQLGIMHVLPPGAEAVGQMRDLLDGDLPTAVFDATGNLASMTSAFQYMANGGCLIYVGLVQADITFHAPEFHRRETTLMGSRNATNADFRRVIAGLESGAINIRPWITHRASPEALIEAMPAWTSPGNGVIKGMLVFAG